MAGLALAVSSCSSGSNETYEYLGTTYEPGIIDLRWNAQDDAFLAGFDLPFGLYESDGLMVYVLWGKDSYGDDIWRPLPQTTTTTAGFTHYNYDYTRSNVYIYLTAEFPEHMPRDYTEGQVFRVVTIPSEWVGKSSLKQKSYGELMQELKASGCSYETIHHDRTHMHTHD